MDKGGDGYLHQQKREKKYDKSKHEVRYSTLREWNNLPPLDGCTDSHDERERQGRRENCRGLRRLISSCLDGMWITYAGKTS